MDITAIAVISILSLSAFVRSAIGFGDALVAMGLLTGWVGLQTATPLVALISAVISSIILASQWRQFELRAALPLILSTLVGIPFGLLLLKVASEQIARAGLGVLLVCQSPYQAGTVWKAGFWGFAGDRFAVPVPGASLNSYPKNRKP